MKNMEDRTKVLLNQNGKYYQTVLQSVKKCIQFWLQHINDPDARY